MDKKLSEKILQHFDFKTMEVLKEYVEDRKNEIHGKMNTARDTVDLFRLQGEISNLVYLEHIRDYAVAIIERDR